MSENGKLVLVAIVAAALGAAVGAGATWTVNRAAADQMASKLVLTEAASQRSATDADSLRAQLGAAKAALKAPATSQTTSPTSSTTPTATVRAPKPKPAVKQFAYITKVVTTGAAPVVTADYAQMLTGDAAARAAETHGDESPPPNDYYIVNDSSKLRKLLVKPGTSVTLTSSDDGTSDPEGHSVSFAKWAGYYAAPTAASASIRGAAYWITIKDGTVIRIAEQYLP